MSPSEVVLKITDVLTAIQSMSGRELTPMNGSTCPIGDLIGFDSMNAVEATVELSSQLGFDLPGANMFVSDDGTKARSISKIAEAVCNVLAEGS